MCIPSIAPFIRENKKKREIYKVENYANINTVEHCDRF